MNAGFRWSTHPTEDWESTTRVLGGSCVERITCSWDWFWDRGSRDW